MKVRIRKDFFEKYMRDNNLTLTEFCKLCKISMYTYKKIINGTGNYSVYSLLKLARVVDMEMFGLFKF